MESAQRPPVAVVTGGSAGVGRATVRELARRGHDVAVLARGEVGLAGAVEDVREAGRVGLGVSTDVADHDSVRRAAERIEDELGEIRVWVNAAFVGSLAFSWDTPLAEVHRITEVTYHGQVHGTLAALEHMRPRNRGVIVNIGSAMAFQSIPLQAAYCGAKHAVKGFTDAVAIELRHEGSAVRLCQVQLPGLNTPQFNWNASRMPAHPMPVPPVFQPETAARAVAFLAEHPRRRTVWVGLSTTYTIMGARFASNAVARLLSRTGVRSQQTEAELPRWGSNVFEPRDAEVDRGARGPFSDMAYERDPLSWLSMHRTSVASATAGTVALALAVFRGRG